MEKQDKQQKPKNACGMDDITFSYTLNKIQHASGVDDGPDLADC